MKGYGHEDTFIGIELERKNIHTRHINNPVLHNRLETANAFIKKIRKCAL